MRPLRVLGICGSPRKGNSLFLLEQAFQGCRGAVGAEISTSLFHFRGRSFHPCDACSHCEKHGGACTHDDDFEELRSLWMAADVILYSVPVYHMGIPAQVKAFFDRLGNSSFGLHRSKLPPDVSALPKLLKVVGAISQGIHAFAGQEHAISQLINHALVMQCVPVTGDLWESYTGAAGWTANRGERNALEALVESEDLAARAAVAASRSLGRRCVEVALVIRAGIAACRGNLSSDPLWAPLLSAEAGT